MDPLLLYGLASAALMLLAFQYLYWRTGEGFLLPWSVAAALWVVRYAIGLWPVAGVWLARPEVFDTLAVARGFLMLYGTFLLMEKRVPKWAAWGAVIAVAVTALLPVLGTPLAILNWTAYGVFAAGCIVAGLAFAREPRFPLWERRLTAWGLGLLGALQLLYPRALVSPLVDSTGLAVAAGLQTIVAVGVPIVFLKQALLESAAVARREEIALTSALSQFTRICAYCKDVESQPGAWEPLTEFVERTTEATVSRRLCDRCAHG